MRGNGIGVGLRAGKIASGAQAADEMEKCRAAGVGAVDGEGIEDVDVQRDAGVVGEYQAKILRQNSDHHGRRPSKTDGSADDCRVGREPPRPDRVRDDQRARGVGGIVLGIEEAAQRRFVAEQRQEIGGDQADLHLLRFAFSGQRSGGYPNAAHLVEFPGPLADLEEFETRSRRAVGISQARPDDRQAIGMRVREGPQEHGIDEAEDRGVGADSDCQGDDNHRGEARAPAQLTQRIADVHGTMLAEWTAGIDFLQPAAGPLQPAAGLVRVASRVEMSEGRSLPETSLAAETEFVTGTAPSRSRLGIGGLRFRAARVSKRVRFQPKVSELPMSWNFNEPATRSLWSRLGNACADREPRLHPEIVPARCSHFVLVLTIDIGTVPGWHVWHWPPAAFPFDNSCVRS